MNTLRSLCICTLGWALSSLHAWARTPVAHADLVKGEVKYLVPGGVTHPLHQGDPLHEQDTIFTGSNGRVKLVFEEGSPSQGNSVVIGPNSRLYILRSALPHQGSGTELQLLQGSVRSSVHKKYSGRGKDVFEVRTPDIVAGVRGTVFQVDYDPHPQHKRSYIVTLQGVVEVKNDLLGVKTLLHAGEFTSFFKNSLEAPQKIQRDTSTQKRLKKFEETAFSEEANSQETVQNNVDKAGKKALYNTSNKTIAERNQIEHAQKLSQQLGLPMEKTLGFVRSKGESQQSRDRAVRRLQEVKSGGGASEAALVNIGKPSKLPQNVQSREPASVSPAPPSVGNNITFDPPHIEKSPTSPSLIQQR